MKRVLRQTFKQRARPQEQDWTQSYSCGLLSAGHETRCVLSDRHFPGQRTVQIMCKHTGVYFYLYYTFVFMLCLPGVLRGTHREGDCGWKKRSGLNSQQSTKSSKMVNINAWGHPGQAVTLDLLDLTLYLHGHEQWASQIRPLLQEGGTERLQPAARRQALQRIQRRQIGELLQSAESAQILLPRRKTMGDWFTLCFCKETRAEQHPPWAQIKLDLTSSIG